MNNYLFLRFKVAVFFAAITLCVVGFGSAQTLHPSAAATSSSHNLRKFAPDSGSSGDSANAPALDEPSPDQLISLLTEQNKRLKAKVERLEKENAELKAKLSEKQ